METEENLLKDNVVSASNISMNNYINDEILIPIPNVKYVDSSQDIAQRCMFNVGDNSSSISLHDYQTNQALVHVPLTSEHVRSPDPKPQNYPHLSFESPDVRIVKQEPREIGDFNADTARQDRLRDGELNEGSMNDLVQQPSTVFVDDTQPWSMTDNSEHLGMDEVHRAVCGFLQGTSTGEQLVVKCEDTDCEPPIVAGETSNVSQFQTMKNCETVNDENTIPKTVNQSNLGSLNLQYNSTEILNSNIDGEIITTEELGSQNEPQNCNNLSPEGDMISNDDEVIDLQASSCSEGNNIVSCATINKSSPAENATSLSSINDNTNTHNTNAQINIVKNKNNCEPDTIQKAKSGVGSRCNLHADALKEQSSLISKQLVICREIDNSVVDQHFERNDLMFKCKSCPWRTKAKLYNMRSHVRSHLGIKPYRCTIGDCEEAFYSFAALKTHAKTHFPIKIQCLLCTKQFLSVKYWSVHQKEHPGKTEHTCKECGLCFHAVVDRNIQTTSVVANRRVFRKVDNSLVDKQIERDGKMCKCKMCPNKAYDRMELIREHIRSHLGIKPFRCTIENCNEAFNSINYLKKHLPQHSTSGFKCEYCPKIYTRHRDWRDHQNVHTGEKPHECKVCGVCFHTYMSRDTHFKSVHRDKKIETQCEICGKIVTGSSVKNHVRRVHKKVIHPYKCSICPAKVYMTKTRFDYHMLRHSENEEFICDICSKSFRSRTALQTHNKTCHTHRFECPKCVKVFSSKNLLLGHLDRHDGIKRHCCKVCGKTFTTDAGLCQHMKTHGERNFVCAICGSKFVRKDYLIKHMKGLHQSSGSKQKKKLKKQE